MLIRITLLQRLQQISLIAVLLTLLLTATASAALVNQKISGTMPAFGTVFDFQISPDGSRVVYTADQETDNTGDLFSTPIDGSSLPLRLNEPLPLEKYIDFFAISPDSSRVIYLAPVSTLTSELYSVPLDGSSPPVKLNNPLVSGGSVQDFQISPDSSRVIYPADQDIDEVGELYRVPVEGGAAPVKLNGPLVNGGDASADFQISPDSSRVVYNADQDTDEVFELFVTYEQPPALSFTTSSATVPEDAGSTRPLVQLSEPFSSDVQVDYAVTGGTATGGGVDYTLTGGTLLFGPGVITQPVEISLTDDTEQEADETVVISLSNPDNAVLGPTTVFTLTITDNDSPGELPAFPIYLPLVIRQ